MSNKEERNEQIVLELSQNNSQIIKNKSYLFWSLFNMLFCSKFFGFAALIASIKVREYNSKNPGHPNSESYSSKALIYNLLATYIGISIITLYVILQIYYFTFRLTEPYFNINYVIYNIGERLKNLFFL